MEITFITGNQGKYEIAKDIFKQYKIKLNREKIYTPEIQSLDVEEVAKFSAKYACKKLNKAVMVSDVGYYIKSLNDFPGAFIKFINKTLTPNDILRLMKNKTDRKMIIKECLALALPEEEPIIFSSELITTISTKASGKGSSIDQVMILDGYDNVKGLLSKEEVHSFFSKNLSVYHDIGKHLEGKN